MNKKSKIRVIKKNRPEAVRKPAPAADEPRETTSREIVSTVSDWVNELRRKREDTVGTFEPFFSRARNEA